MKMKIIGLWLVIGILHHPLYALQGTVRNIHAQPIANAQVEFTNATTGEKFSTRTNTQGVFQINLKLFEASVDDKDVHIFGNYPNPFFRETIIPFHLKRKSKITLRIIDRGGRVVATPIDNEEYPAGMSQYRYHALGEEGQLLPPGLYVAQLSNGKSSYGIKLLIRPALSEEPSIRNIDPSTVSTISPITYQLKISATGYNDYENQQFIAAEKDERFFVLHQDEPLPWKTVDHYLARKQIDGTYKPFFVNGMNMGIATPGTNPGNLAASKEEYRRWLEIIWEAGFNSIRTYTIHFPRFYEVLDEFNAEHVEKPLWLCQGIWLDDEVVTGNLYDKESEYLGDIEEVIDAMHGNRTIPERAGRASGTYTLDISPWIMSWMLGREVYPDEVIGTDSLNPNKTEWNGEYVSIQGASPSETWFAQMIDFTFKHEIENYGAERPVGNSSWPTLDPLFHPTELPELSDEDITQIDLNLLQFNKAQGGYYTNYHAYPYYPDFISMDPGYQTFSDQYGPNSYVGYLTDLKNHYGTKPVLIGEYGVPSSWGSASYAHSGMDHGGHTEEMQGFYNIRMLQNIHSTQCAGGFAFAWIDEWFKTMWFTNPYSPVKERRAFWHNAVSAEENFGLIAFETDTPSFTTWPIQNNDCFEKLVCDYGQDFFYIHVKLNQELNANDTLWIAIDTYDKELGESILPNGLTLSESRAEFILKITQDTGKLYVTEAYNPFAINIYHIDSTFAKSEAKWHSTRTDGAPWEIFRLTNGYRSFEVDTLGHLHVRKPNENPINKHSVIWKNETEFLVRLPWTYLLVADPSQQLVVHDFRWTKENERRTTDGIFVTAYRNNSCALTSKDRMLWPRWDEAWPYKERIKDSYWIVKEANETLNLEPF